MLIKIHTNRGYCLARLERFKDAVLDYDCVIALDPNNRHAKHNRLVTMSRIENIEKKEAERKSFL